MVGFSSCLLLSCVDDTSDVGLELQNPNDKVYVFNDSIDMINTYTYQRSDSIYLSPSFMLLGYNNDNRLGVFENNFMTEVALTKFDVNFGSNPVADSLVLFLDYAYSYGDTSQTQNITIYELNMDLSINDTANSIHGRPMDESVVSEYYIPTELASFSFTPNPADTLPIRIKLPNTLRDKLLDTKFYATQDTFSNNIFRGFYFKANVIADGGAISYFNYGSLTRMELHYHNDNKDSIKYIYDINASTYKCNIFYRTPNPDIKSLPIKTEPDLSYEQELFYIKNNNAFEGRIDISDLQAWADTLGYFSINKAFLTIYAELPETLSDSLYYPPSTLEAYKIDNDFKKAYLEEYYSSNGYLKINYDSLLNGHGYRVNIKSTLYKTIQSGENTLSLILTTDGVINKSTANRYILKGAHNTEQPIKLEITYTKFNVE